MSFDYNNAYLNTNFGLAALVDRASAKGGQTGVLYLTT